MEIGTSGRPCGLCSSDEVAVMQSVESRMGLARLNPWWSPRIRVYDRCRTCGAKQPAEALQPA
jgi:hypothetical protein